MKSLNLILCSVFYFIAFFPLSTSAGNATIYNDEGVLPSFAAARSGDDGMTPLHSSNSLLQARQYCDAGYGYCSGTLYIQETRQLFPKISSFI